MAEKKECFGQLANIRVGFRDHSKQHYLSVDNEKLKECDRCPLFGKCLFLRYNELFKELLRLMDESGVHDAKPRLG
jgi:hypothetical protein